MRSLNARLLLASSVILASFLGITGLTLDAVFSDNAYAAFEDRLRGQVFALIADAEQTEHGGIRMAQTLPEARLLIVRSGLYAAVSRSDGSREWLSPSLPDDLSVPFVTGLERAERRFAELLASDGTPLLSYNFGVSWDDRATAPRFTFSVAETLDGYQAQVHEFRRSLWGWLSAAGVLLLLTLLGVLHWGLAPLRKVAAEIKGIETGSQARLAGLYPRELRVLTDNLNALLVQQREHLERYRNALGELAHSLKTPLALLRGAVESNASEAALRSTIQSQVDKMSEIVAYRLQRAATSGRSALSAPIAIDKLVADIVDSLGKVYADKHVACTVDIAPGTHYHGDRGDLMELLGNVLDNAYKWCRGRVEIDAESLRAGLLVTVRDDGPGIPAEKLDLVLQRGIRADDKTAGHGIGLAVVRDIVAAYAGRLEFKTGGDGLTVHIELPGD